MNEKNYTIQFEFDGQTQIIQCLSHCDFSKGNAGDAMWMVEQISIYMESIGKPANTAVKNARLFGKDGELIVRVEDTAKI